MKKNSLLLNKYTVAIFILMSYFAVDVLLHKGMSRVLLPATFTENRMPANFKGCEQALETSGKSWIKAVNTVENIERLPSDVAGFEMDVYFDTLKNCLLLYHDSTAYSLLNIEKVLNVYRSKKLTASIWFDFKNLSGANELQALRYISSLRNTYRLHNKLIVESSHPEYLQSFCDSGFFTSYYAPFFNPYQDQESEIIKNIDSIAANIKRYHVSALSGYYFQYPLLKKYFPGFPLLTWADDSRLSVVGYLFNRKLFTDEQLKVILLPLE